MSIDRSKLEPEWQQAFDFVESVVGGSIVEAERQARWRPAFFIDVKMPDGTITSVFFRGAREQKGGLANLKHEYNCLCILEKNGIEVPHIYGYCEQPAGIVMAKAPGRFDLVNNAEDQAEVVSVMEHYMEILARMHQIPIDDFVAAGIPALSTPEELAWGDTRLAEAGLRQSQVRPEPCIDFILDWLGRNQPKPGSNASFVVADSGQFLFDKGKVTGIIDIELGYIGDPAVDLAGLFVRDVSEPLGDLVKAIDHYEQCRGSSVDLRAVMYHSIRWGINTPLYIANLIARPPAFIDYIQYLGWYLVYQRCPLQQIAYLENVEVVDPALPEKVETPYTTSHDALLDRLQGFKTDSDYQAYEIDRLARMAEYLRRADAYGAEIEKLDFDDVKNMTGKRPSDWQQCDQLLVDFVERNNGEYDTKLLRYFIRRFKRQEFLLEPALRELQGATIQVLPL